MSMQLQLIEPWWLLALLPVVPALVAELRGGGGAPPALQADIEKFGQRPRHRAAWRRRLRALLLAGFAGLLVLALSGPELVSQQPLTGTDRSLRQKTLLFAIDVSRSMSGPLALQDRAARLAAYGNANADQGPTRYGAARDTVYRMLERFPSARAGLILFSAEPFLARWPTTDTAGRFIEVLGDDLSGNNQLRRFASLTNTDDALELARNVFAKLGPGSSGAVIHVSDAEDELGNMGLAIRRLRADGIRLYTIGVGISESAVTALSAEFAGDPGFRIFHADSEAEMEQAFRLVAAIEAGPRISGGEQAFVTPLSQVIAALLAALLALGAIVAAPRLQRAGLRAGCERRRE